MQSNSRENISESEPSNSWLVHATSVGVSGKKRLVVAPAHLLANNELTFTRLNHPRTGSLSLFHVSPKGKVFELLKAGEKHRCWFVDQSVASEGSLLLLSPVHPLYLVLPTLPTLEESTYLPYKDLIANLLYGAPQLLDNNDLESSLARVCRTKHRKGVTYYCYEEELCLDWLCEQVEKLKSAFQRHKLLHSTILSNAASLSMYAVDTLCDYLNAYMEEKLKAHLGIASPCRREELNVTPQHQSVVEPTENYFVEKNTYNLRSRRTLSAPQKRLALASKGTALLSSFFSK
uniref:Ribonuclease H2 subunit B n=1 Tax=Trichuris muris TaxID=70415 RepID=A0A5S6R112_TRIMR